MSVQKFDCWLRSLTTGPATSTSLGFHAAVRQRMKLHSSTFPSCSNWIGMSQSQITAMRCGRAQKNANPHLLLQFQMMKKFSILSLPVYQKHLKLFKLHILERFSMSSLCVEFWIRKQLQSCFFLFKKCNEQINFKKCHLLYFCLFPRKISLMYIYVKRLFHKI